MAPRILAGLVLAASITTACDDIAQKKPQTVSTIEEAVSALSTSARSTVTDNAREPVETRSLSDSDVTPGERSVRLFGRGVNRQRQIRV